MLFMLPALGASIAYSSDVLFGKLALDEMPMYIFIFILAACYTVVAICMYLYDRKTITGYIAKKQNLKHILLAVVAVVVGTIVADVLMWYAVKKSSHKHLPIANALIHTAPVFAIFLVAVFFRQYLQWKAIIGVILVIIGTIICITT